MEYLLENGIRCTVGNPEEYINTIYVIGACSAFGIYVEDSFTISSILQEKINELDIPYRVINLGSFDTTNITELIDKLILYDGDIIINMSYICSDRKVVNYYDLSELFTIDLRKDCFVNSYTHVNLIGNSIIGDKIFSVIQNSLKSNKSDLKKNTYDNIFYNDINNYEECYQLYRYTKLLKEEFLVPNSKNNGAIVMNCNPFTNGHKFLIEYAAKQVDHLYIFVVEEDKSNFSFKDRFRLVKEGVKHLDNVTVLSSGQFIISAATFPEYFTKSEKNDIVIDPSSDVKIFAKYIAPSLNIVKRFAGNEPNDRITAQYNEAMKLILPQYGVEFIEISRVEAGGQVVSASKVRKLMESNDISEIAKIVPKTTLDYIVELLNTTQSQPELTLHK